MDSIFKATIENLLERCSEFGEIDADRINETLVHVLKNKDSSASASLAELERRWYASLPVPDYTVYEHHDYIAELWGCWVIYSRKYLKNFQKDNSFTRTRSILSVLENPKTVLDLGCGFGHTAAAWKELIPDANVIGTNVPDTLQMSVAESMGNDYGFTMMETPPETNVDVVFASEYFEHIENPIAHLRMLVARCNPRLLLVANAFGQNAIGHFVDYEVGHKHYHGKHMSRVFTFAMNKLGYVRVNTRLWNQRPALWARAEG